MMEDHLPKMAMMASASPSGSSGTDDSRGKKPDREERQVMEPPRLSAPHFKARTSHSL